MWANRRYKTKSGTNRDLNMLVRTQAWQKKNRITCTQCPFALHPLTQRMHTVLGADDAQGDAPQAVVLLLALSCSREEIV